MKNTGKLHVERFLAAAAAGDEDKAEALVPFLSAADKPILHAMATSGDADRRWWALRALAAVGDAETVHILAGVLADANAHLRAVAAMSLGVLYATHPDAVALYLEDLAHLLADEDAQTQQAAVTALVQCGDGAVPVLAKALQSEDAPVRVYAARALYGIGSMKVAPPLYHHLDDANPLVRHYAFEALDRLGLLENQLFTRK